MQLSMDNDFIDSALSDEYTQCYDVTDTDGYYEEIVRLRPVIDDLKKLNKQKSSFDSVCGNKLDIIVDKKDDLYYVVQSLKRIRECLNENLYPDVDLLDAYNKTRQIFYNNLNDIRYLICNLNLILEVNAQGKRN